MTIKIGDIVRLESAARGFFGNVDEWEEKKFKEHKGKLGLVNHVKYSENDNGNIYSLLDIDCRLPKVAWYAENEVKLVDKFRDRLTEKGLKSEHK